MPNSKQSVDERLRLNIERRRKEKRMNGVRLAECSDVPINTLRKIMDGTTTNPKYKTVAALAEALDCSVSELIGECSEPSGIESRLLRLWDKLNESSRQAVMDIAECLVSTQEKLEREREVCVEREVPLYSLPVSAGLGNFLDSSGYEYLTYRAEDIPKAACFAVRVTGDSMEPLFFNEDIVLVEPTAEPVNGDIVIAVINGDSYIKQFRDGQFISLNPKYSTIQPTEYDNVRIVGRVSKPTHSTCTAQPLSGPH